MIIEQLNACLKDVLARVMWPDLTEDTVLNFWLMRQAPVVSVMSLRCDWPRAILDAQGDKAAEMPQGFEETLHELRLCIPTDVCGISFRVKLLAGGVLDDDPVFHTEAYRWTKVED